MVTNLLQEIRDLLKGINDYMSSIKDSVDHVADLMEALELLIESIDTTLAAIANDVDSIADDTHSIATDTTYIKNDVHSLDSNVAIMKQNDIDHYLASETALSAIQGLTQVVANAVAIVRDTLIHTDNQVTAIKGDTTNIAGYSASIADSTGQSAALLDDIATNTLTSANRLTSLVADSTMIIQLLRDLIQEVHDHA